MRTCVVQAYGLGNGILTTPLVQAVRLLGHDVDVLLDARRAAWPVFQGWSVVDHVIDLGSSEAQRTVYDIAVFAHPSEYHRDMLRFERLLEPVLEPIPGKDYMWWFDRHEVLVLMELAHELGYTGPTPSIYVPVPAERVECPPGAVAVGIGYLKQGNKISRERHWGNANYVQLCRALLASGLVPVLIGDSDDCADAAAIVEAVGSEVRDTCGKLGLHALFGLVSQCVAYVGNDTGNMHVAAACGIPTLGIFTNTNPVKSAPWCNRACAMTDATVDLVRDRLEEWGVIART